MINSYENGDILCFIKSNNKDKIFRKCFYANDDKTRLNLIALNNNSSETLEIEDFMILGEVKKITINID